MGLVDPTACFYQIVFDENDINDTKIKQFYYAWNGIMHQVKYFCGTYVLCVFIHS